MSEEFKDYIQKRPKKTPLPSWPIQFSIAINVLKNTLGLLKNNISQAQLLTKSTHPIPFNQYSISKVSIPRRKNVIPTPDYAPELSQGEFSAEWMASKSVTYNSNGKIILFAHAIDYRLSPKFTFPCALHDFLSAYLYLIDPPVASLCDKYDPKQIIFVGDSAGGNMAVAGCIWLQEHGFPLPSGLIGLSPWLDLSHSFPSFQTNFPYDYLPSSSEDPRHIHSNRMHYLVKDNSEIMHPLVSPVYSKRLSGDELPPCLFQVGDAEKLRDEVIYFALKSNDANIRVEMYQDMPHVFQLFSGLSTFPKLALKRVGRFVRSLDSKEYLDSKSHVIWCKRDKNEVKITVPLEILEIGKLELVNTDWDSTRFDKLMMELKDSVLLTNTESSTTTSSAEMTHLEELLN